MATQTVAAEGGPSTKEWTPGYAAERLLQRVEGAKDGRTSWTFFDVRMSLGSRPIYKGLRGWRNHRLTGHVADDPTARQHGHFEEIPLCSADMSSEDATEESGRSWQLYDSILQIPSLVSAAECAHLVAAADDWCEQDEWSGVALRRIECHPDGISLDGRSHALSHIILTRVLWYLEVLRPDLAAALFPDASDLADLHFKFSGQEPMLNRYTIGGSFDPHQDGHALTVLVPLSTPDHDFGGGGTAFWSESTIGTDPKQAQAFPPSLVMKPAAGTALLWRGHLTHAGLPVTSGMRHVFVASFDLRIPRQRG